MSATVVFSIAEIFRNICTFLEDDRKTLLSLVLCNSVVSDIALDVLWAKLDSMKPLMPFIPGDLLYASSDVDIGAEAFLQSSCPPAEEWRTFDKYARRVRNLHSADPMCAWMDGRRLIYPRLAALRARGGVDLFPNLRSVVCFLSEPGLGKEKLLPSSLQSLTSFAMGYIQDEEGHTNTLVQLASHAPLLEQLSLRGLFRSLVTGPVQPLRLAYLREVDLTRASISHRNFQYLCGVLCEAPIMELSIHLKQPLVEWPSLPPIFPVLRRLTFCGDPLIAHDFLERLPNSTLVEFIIEHEDSMIQLGAYESLLGFLNEQFSDSLHSVHLNFGRQPVEVPHHYFIAHTLMALIPLVEGGLEELRYSMPVMVESLPEELQRVLDPSMWPTLRVFSFSTRSPRCSDRELEERMKIWGPMLTSFRLVQTGGAFGGNDL